MAYIKSSSITGGTQHESILHLYLHQTFLGPNKNQTVVTSTQNPLGFGDITVDDWPICVGRDPGSKVVARAHGMHTQCGQNKQRWDMSFNFLFEDDSFNGSTLAVRGLLPITTGLFEWAIVGGTGQFSLAQGIVSGRKTDDATRSIMELSIHVFYRTIQKSTMP